MKSICRYKAFSPDGNCTMGEKCICAANERFLSEPEGFVPSENDKDVCANCGQMFFHCNCGEAPASPETIYTHYQIDLEDMPVEWNTTICDSLEAVGWVLQYLDTCFDDPECKGRAIITGIGMSRAAFKQWQEENLKQ